MERLPAQCAAQFLCYHDEEVDFYIHGVLAAKTAGFTADYDTIPLSAAGKAALHTGANTIAAHGHQTGSGQYLDIGLVNVGSPTP